MPETELDILSLIDTAFAENRVIGLVTGFRPIETGAQQPAVAVFVLNGARVDGARKRVSRVGGRLPDVRDAELPAQVGREDLACRQCAGELPAVEMAVFGVEQLKDL